MSSIPTIRVEHVLGHGFMTINFSDFVPGKHVVYSEQAEDFDYSLLAVTTGVLDPALRDLAADLMLRAVAFRLEAQGTDFNALSNEEKFLNLKEREAELNEAIDQYHFGKNPEISSRQEILRNQSEAHQTTTQDTSGVTDVSREDNPGQNLNDSSSQEPGQSLDDQGPTVIQPLEASDVLVELTIEPIRGKFYVMRGTEKVSEGHKLRSAAEEELKKLTSTSE